MGLKSKVKKTVKKTVKKVNKVATASNPVVSFAKKGIDVVEKVKEAAAPIVAVAAPVAAAYATGGLSAVVPFATATFANQVQQYVPLQEDYFPAQNDYASQVSLSAELSPPERELFYRQAYNNALKSVPSVEEGGGFLSVLLRILFG